VISAIAIPTSSAAVDASPGLFELFGGSFCRDLLDRKPATPLHIKLCLRRIANDERPHPGPIHTNCSGARSTKMTKEVEQKVTSDDIGGTAAASWGGSDLCPCLDHVRICLE
jgi:hypothetical protein